MIKLFNSDATTLEIEQKTPPNNSQLITWLGNDPYDLIYIWFDGNAAELLFNGTAVTKNLPINSNATTLYLSTALQAGIPLFMLTYSNICGTALILTREHRLK